MKESNFSLFDSFPTGLMILENQYKCTQKDKFPINISYMNSYTRGVFNISQNSTSEEIERSLKSFKQLENFEKSSDIDCLEDDENLYSYLIDHQETRGTKGHHFTEKFVSEDHIIYVKIKNFNEQILISIDNMVDERRHIERNMKKNIRSQLLLTMSHEINNPLNSLLNICEEIYDTAKLEHCENKLYLMNVIKTNITLVKFFIRNFTIYLSTGLNDKVCVLRDNLNNGSGMNSFNLKFMLEKIEKKLKGVFYSKSININSKLETFGNVVVSYDYLNFKWLIKNIFIFFYHQISSEQALKIETKIINSKEIEISFEHNRDDDVRPLKNYNRKSATRFVSNVDKSFLNQLDIESSVKTVFMIRELINTIADTLNIELEFKENHFLKFKLRYFQDDFLFDVPSENSRGHSKHKNVFKCGSREKFWNKYTNSFRLYPTRKKSSYTSLGSKKSSSSILDNFKHFKEDKFYNKTHLAHGKNLNLSNHNICGNTSNTPSLEITKRVSKNKGKKFLGIKSSKTLYVYNHINGDLNVIEESLSNKTSYNKAGSMEISIPVPDRTSRKFLSPSIDESRQHILIQLNNDTECLSSNGVSSSRSDRKSKSSDFNSDTITPNDVLVVDDDNFNLKIMRSILKNNKIKCDTCVNGQECVDLVQNKQYKIIFMDIMMPVMDGIEASKKIQELIDQGKVNENLVIIIISAHEVEEIIGKVKQIKVIKEFLTKPVNKTKIKDMLDKFYY